MAKGSCYVGGSLHPNQGLGIEAHLIVLWCRLSLGQPHAMTQRDLRCWQAVASLLRMSASGPIVSGCGGEMRPRENGEISNIAVCGYRLDCRTPEAPSFVGVPSRIEEIHTV